MVLFLPIWPKLPSRLNCVKKPQYPARKSGCEWASGFKPTDVVGPPDSPQGQNSFFYRRSLVRKHGVLHLRLLIISLSLPFFTLVLNPLVVTPQGEIGWPR